MLHIHVVVNIDGCQNRVFADQCHMTILCAQVSIHQGYVFFEAIH